MDNEDYNSIMVETKLAISEVVASEFPFKNQKNLSQNVEIVCKENLERVALLFTKEINNYIKVSIEEEILKHANK